MKVFLDIGAHVGETLVTVRDQKWGFESIVCFEPAQSCWPQIDALADSRVEVCKFGLWDKDESLDLYNSGAIGASMSAEKDMVKSSSMCEFRNAAAWFQENVLEEDTVYVKINAEGAEVEIIRCLAEAHQLAKIDYLLIHFDVRKVPSKRHQEAEARAMLEAAQVNYVSADEIQLGGVYRGTRNWLGWCHARRARYLRFKVFPRLAFGVRRRLYPLKVRLRRYQSVV